MEDEPAVSGPYTPKGIHQRSVIRHCHRFWTSFLFYWLLNCESCLSESWIKKVNKSIPLPPLYWESRHLIEVLPITSHALKSNLEEKNKSWSTLGTSPACSDDGPGSRDDLTRQQSPAEGCNEGISLLGLGWCFRSGSCSTTLSSRWSSELTSA